MEARKKAVFLDKDGTLIDDVPYNADPRLITLSDKAGAGLRLFDRLGYRLLVVSNQPGIALGRFDEAALAGAHRRLDRLLEREGVRLDGYYYCPHHPDGPVGAYARSCDCRKPQPGMLLRAAAEHGIDLSASWMIGDILHDIEAGRRAGCKTILIDNGNETEWMLSAMRMPDLTAPNLQAAALLAAAWTDAANTLHGERDEAR
ncbi:MAG: family hydrolase [Herbaspirillum sp.]|jgi:D-glycero-D-manno-heptose 1,7-bisphosphate phosphatase|nr:family hydrolase [Herbaspirillum sp.]